MISHNLGQGLIWIISFYKRAVSPYIPPACRHEPTCSTYALESISKHGLWKGSTLAMRRILRCNPLGTKGYDPVP